MIAQKRLIRAFSIVASCAVLSGALQLAAAPAIAKDGMNKALLGGAAAGIVGGLAAGALLNGGQQRPLVENSEVEEVPAPRRPAPRYVEEEEEVVVRRRAPARYVPTCHTERRKVWLDNDEYTYKQVEVCN
jgi:hypothetical protein